ncbi:class II aldolase/adducin family protein [Bdellovibrionota bacterium]
MLNEQAIRNKIVTICRWMHERGYIASTDGNVSVRLSTDLLLMTPSGVNKGHLTPDQILVTDLEGKKITGEKEPSSEILMHLKVYALREDVQAIIHAHPPISTAFSVAGKSLSIPALTEVVLTLGEIPTAPYATPSTDEVPKSIASLIESHDALILERHGSLTVGSNLSEAYNNLERIEHAAEILFYASQLGGIRPLPEDEIRRLQNLGKNKKKKSVEKLRQPLGKED